MGWNKWYISVAGIYTDRLYPYPFDTRFTINSWTATGYFRTITCEMLTSATSYDPSSQGWTISSLTFPATLFTFVSRDEDGNITRYIRGRMPDNNTWYWEDSTDGNTWTVRYPYSGVASYDWGVLTIREYNEKQYLGIMFYKVNPSPYFTVGAGILFDVEAWEEDYGKLDAVEFSEEYGEESTEGGYTDGTFDDSSDTISIPSMPAMGITDAGFVNVYNPSSNALAQLGEDLFPDFTPIAPYSPTGNTVVDAITDVAEALANIAQNIPNAIEMFNNSMLMNYIIDCHIIPCAPSVGSSAAIKIGYRTMTQTAPKVTSDYVDIDCGSINIGEYYNNFIDYGPYTQAKLFLPFVGFVPIEPEYFQSGTLKVYYRFNVIDGSFMAFVLSSSSKSRLKDTVIGQWGGNACVHIPITGVNYSNMVSGVVAGASAVAAQLGQMNLLGAADAALNTAAAAPALQASNGYNATTSFLSVRTPYLVIERSVSHYARNYKHEQGFPSEITADWSKLSGYTESDSVHLEGIGATEEELKEIASLLAEGVIL